MLNDVRLMLNRQGSGKQSGGLSSSSHWRTTPVLGEANKGLAPRLRQNKLVHHLYTGHEPLRTGTAIRPMGTHRSSWNWVLQQYTFLICSFSLFLAPSDMPKRSHRGITLFR